MAIQIALLLPIVKELGKELLEIPLIHYAIENYVNKTVNKWDGVVWFVVEKYMHITDPVAQSVAIRTELVAVQHKYDGVKKMVAAGTPEKVAFTRLVGFTPMWMDGEVGNG
jgi:UTP-glucose-1-phosphate uridylyltransferase